MRLALISVLLLVLSGCSFLKGHDDKKTAHIYENKKTGQLVYCSNDAGRHVRQFRYIGTGRVNEWNIKHCEFVSVR